MKKVYIKKNKKTEVFSTHENWLKIEAVLNQVMRERIKESLDVVLEAMKRYAQQYKK